MAESKISVEAEIVEKELRRAEPRKTEIGKSEMRRQKSATKMDNWEMKRSVNLGIKTLMRSLREDNSWQAVQAKRRFEKEDMLNNNPSFDPIFMKV